MRAATDRDGVGLNKALGSDRPSAPMTGTSQPGRPTPRRSGAGNVEPHMLEVTWSNGWSVTVDCPFFDQGNKRPCAVWANEDGSEREDECTFQQYADASYFEDWLHGPIRFEPVPIQAEGSGDDWHAVEAK